MRRTRFTVQVRDSGPALAFAHLLAWGLVLGLGLFAGQLNAQTVEKPPVGEAGPLLTHTWPGSPDAVGYVVEIRDRDGRVVLRERTRRSRVEFRLAPGAYEYRISILNKFRKPGPWSPWAPLLVRLSLTPGFESVTPRRIPAAPPAADGAKRELPPRRLVVRGTNLLPATQVQVRGEGPESKPLAVERVEFISAEEIHVYVRTEELRVGRLNVTLVNPGNKRSADEKNVSVVPPTRADTVTMIRPMEQDPARKGRPADPEAVAKRAVAERQAMRRRALIPGLGPLQRGNPWEIGLWGTLYGSYLVGGLHEWKAANAAAAAARNEPLSYYTNPLVVLFTGSRLSSNSDQNGGTIVIGSALLAHRDITRLNREYARHVERQYAIGALALGTYLVQVYGESFRGFDLGKLLPGLPQYKAGNWQEGLLWGSGIAALTIGSLYAFDAANREARNIENDPIVGTLSTGFGAAFLYAGLTSTGNLAFPSTLALAQSRHSAAESDYNQYNRAGQVMAVGAVAVAVAYLVNVPAGAEPAAATNAAGRSSNREQATLRGFPILVPSTDARGRTTAQVGWAFVF